MGNINPQLGFHLTPQIKFAEMLQRCWFIILLHKNILAQNKRCYLVFHPHKLCIPVVLRNLPVKLCTVMCILLPSGLWCIVERHSPGSAPDFKLQSSNSNQNVVGIHVGTSNRRLGRVLGAAIRIRALHTFGWILMAKPFFDFNERLLYFTYWYVKI